MNEGGLWPLEFKYLETSTLITSLFSAGAGGGAGSEGSKVLGEVAVVDFFERGEGVGKGGDTFGVT